MKSFKKKRISTIILQPDDVALIVKANGDIRVYLPKLKDEENVPNNVLTLSLLAILLKDKENKEFKEFLDKQLVRYFKNEKE